ncbi:MAG: NADH oxidase, partial [Clostridiaceae bacterium]|nr:NADH oxidase [Clostridiaceae bacterium]
MSKQYPILFSEGQIGNLKIKNRVVMPAMGMNQSDRGFVNDAVINHYERRAKGGVGLIIVEVTCVDTPLGRNTENMLVIDDDKYIEGMKKLVDAIHKHGAKCFLQISHTGRGARREYIKEQPVGPSEVAMTYSFMIGYGNEAPRSLTVEEIKTIEDKYAAAA